jgi:hypothetical protein
LVSYNVLYGIKSRRIDWENTTQVATNWGSKVSNFNSFLVGQIASQNNAADSSSILAGFYCIPVSSPPTTKEFGIGNIETAQ